MDATSLLSLGIQPIEAPKQHAPIEGQKSLFSDETDETRIESLAQLEKLCKAGPDAEYWQSLAVAIAQDVANWTPVAPPAWHNQTLWEAAIGALYTHRLDLRNQVSRDAPTQECIENQSAAADTACTDEINLFLQRLFQGDDMVTKAAKPKASTTPETDDELLARSLSYDDGRFAKLKGGATDDQVLVAIRERWRMAKVFAAGKRNYDTEVDDRRWGTAIWFDHDHDKGERPALCYRLSTDGKRLEASLIDAVRRVMNIPHVNEAPVAVVDTKAAKKPKAKGTAGYQPAGSAPMGVVLGPIERKPLAWFSRSRWQEREEHSQEWLDEFTANMKRYGQLESCVALPTGELISGHTRLEVAPGAGLKELDVRIANVDDDTAQALVMFYNTKRKDLSQRERCQHYQKLLASYEARGLNQSDLARDLEMDRSTLSNELRLSSLPDQLWAKQEAGGFTIEQARRLAIHAARPLFVEGVLAHLKTIGCELHVQPEPHHFESVFSKGIERAFRPMTKDHFGGGCQFKPTAKQLEELEVIEVERHGGKEKMAANVKLWNELNLAAKKKKKETVATSNGAASSTGGGATPSAPAKAKDDERLRRQHGEKVRSWGLAYVAGIEARFAGKVKKVDMPIVIRLAMLVQRDAEIFQGRDLLLSLDDLTADEPTFSERCLAVVQSYFSRSSPVRMTYEDVQLLGRWLNIQPAEFWKPMKGLLETCTDAELVGFMKQRLQLPGDREANLSHLVEHWEAGDVPDLFLLEKPNAKKKGVK